MSGILFFIFASCEPLLSNWKLHVLYAWAIMDGRLCDIGYEKWKPHELKWSIGVGLKGKKGGCVLPCRLLALIGRPFKKSRFCPKMTRKYLKSLCVFMYKSLCVFMYSMHRLKKRGEPPQYFEWGGGLEYPLGPNLLFLVRVCGPDFQSAELADWFLPLKEGSCELNFSNLGAWELKFGQKIWDCRG